MLLKDNGMQEKAEKLEKAIYETIALGKTTTQDIGGTATCSAYTDALIERL